MSLVAGAVTTLTLAVAFGALALGFDWFWVAFPAGFGGVLPAAVGYTRRRAAERDDRAPARRDDDAAAETDPETDSAPDLETLRTRYARGDLTDEQFRRRVDRLVETE